MTREDARALRIAAVTIRNAGHLYEAARHLQNGKIAPLDRVNLAALAERSCRELLEARYIVEACATSGPGLPGLALDLADLLAGIGRPPWLDFILSHEAAGWQESAEAIVTAARSAALRTRAQSTGKGAETAQILTSTPDAAPNTIHHLNTAKTAAEQERIFAALVEAGFIAGTDSAGASMLQPFLRAFNPDAREQGRITWTKTPHDHGLHAKPSATAALDFLALMAGGVQQLCADFGRDSLPVLFPGLAFSKSTISRFVTAWNKDKGSEYHAELNGIINPTK